MDFVKINPIHRNKDKIELVPIFHVGRNRDLMIRGRDFYAFWDEDAGLWSTDLDPLVEKIDALGWETYENLKGTSIKEFVYKPMGEYQSGHWEAFRRYLKSCQDSYKPLDNKITFADEKVTREDYRSRRLPYFLRKEPCPAYDELVSTLYDPEERQKFEWAIGSIFVGKATEIQKFLVFYGPPGSGKSTILNIVQKLFEDYYVMFEAKALATNDDFALEQFKTNPLVAIQHDGDLSKIEDNTKLNSIVSREPLIINEKHKSRYSLQLRTFMMMGTNKPVKITDAKSGLIRRLLDVHPSGRTVPRERYFQLIDQIDFELGAIAQHCIDVFNALGSKGYSGYKPQEMIEQTDIFYNFVEDNAETFMKEGGITLSRAYDIWKTWSTDSGLTYTMPKYKFKTELKEYFDEFYPKKWIGEGTRSNWYSGFRRDKFTIVESLPEETPKLILEATESLLDDILKDCKAQYANENEVPTQKWANVNTTLKDILTNKLHYVQPPDNHIVIDFDLKNENGEKDQELNLIAAAKFPPTYAELSKGGHGVHLHYIYTGDPTLLAPVYDEDVEVKVFTGNASLRRRVSKCNDIPVATISDGLPLKGAKKVINNVQVKTEQGLRRLIERNLKKEIHAKTTPSVQFIKKILDDAYSRDNLTYDVTDMRPKILAFAANSTNQSELCLKLVNEMKFKSKEEGEAWSSSENAPLVFFDIECFPNLFLICWKFQGKDGVTRMFNPSPSEVEDLFRYRLVGFNNRRYDNHMLYGAYQGYSNEELYRLSQKLTSKDSKNAMFGAAYNISYTDVYDFASAANKKSLKKFEIELGLHHQECPYPWDQPVAKEHWLEVADYCDNDVISTEIVFDHLKGDWKARQILAELSGLSVNDATNKHITRIIFGNEKNTQQYLQYTDLSEMFPGYIFENGKSTYRDEEVGEGGYVYAEPGIYRDVALLDIASMHPTSIEQLNLFGKFTKHFSDIKQARVLIKHKDFDAAKRILDGKLAPYLDDPGTAKDLSNALKTAINSVYGLTSAKFDNPFRDIRNKDNIVAKRGALFMIDLKHMVQEAGFTVAHIKTDSIKIPNATPEIIEKVMKFGEAYGYTFEHEATYDRMCLVNDAVYIAKYQDGDWTATGAQFAHPYIFKKLFSHEPVLFKDLREAKSVQTSMYLDMNEDLPEGEHQYRFVGRVGSFVPVKEGCGGGLLMRLGDDGKYSAVAGTKGHRWLEYEQLVTLGKQDMVDYTHYEDILETAIQAINKYGPIEEFVDGYMPPWQEADGPWAA